ncbi:STAS domain-containing protein [Streptomyces microflavus]|uniref:STAS domain-containing protein n=1 Tax=Streptomyces microflavus TaxID=1919 RepID=UPI0036669636
MRVGSGGVFQAVSPLGWRNALRWALVCREAWSASGDSRLSVWAHAGEFGHARRSAASAFRSRVRIAFVSVAGRGERVKPFRDRRSAVALGLALVVAALWAGTLLREEVLRILCLCAAAVGLRVALVNIWPGVHPRLYGGPSQRVTAGQSVVRVLVQGEINGASMARTAHRVADLLGPETQQICIDFHTVTGLSEDGARELGSFIRTARHQGVLTVINGASPSVRSSLRQAELDHLVTYAGPRRT